MNTPKLPLLALSFTLPQAIACYGSAPPRPEQVQLPSEVPGATLQVRSTNRTQYEKQRRERETCPSNGSRKNCFKTEYTETVPVTRTYTTATYADEPISYGQFQVLSDDNYREDLTTLAEHSKACKQANIPRYVGLGLIVGGLIGASLGGDNAALLGYGGVGAGLASYAGGYYLFGGKRCVQAAELFGEINYARNSGVTEAQGAQTAEEMRVLSEQFNARAEAAEAARSVGGDT